MKRGRAGICQSQLEYALKVLKASSQPSLLKYLTVYQWKSSLQHMVLLQTFKTQAVVCIIKVFLKPIVMPQKVIQCQSYDSLKSKVKTMW